MTILPPDSLFLPVLPVTSGGKMKFALCRLCLETMRAGFCRHTDDERAFTGVWTTAEVAFAVGCGYRLLHVWELFVYRKSAPIFRDFYTRLARIKIKSEGLPAHLVGASRSKRDVYVARLNRQMPGLNLSLSDVIRNEPMRQFAKGKR